MHIDEFPANNRFWKQALAAIGASVALYSFALYQHRHFTDNNTKPHPLTRFIASQMSTEREYREKRLAKMLKDFLKQQKRLENRKDAAYLHSK